MKLLLTLDSHVFRTPDNNYWCNGITDYEFLKRYLDVFEEIKVFVRVKDIDANDLPKKVLLLSGKSVEIYPLPFCRKMKEYLLSLRIYSNRIRNGINDIDCAILRLPSIISLITYQILRKTRKPFAVELVADIETNKFSFVNSLIKHRIKRICVRANGVSYVTKNYLQKKYPCNAIRDLTYPKKRCFTDYYSSISLKKSFFGYPKTYTDKSSYTIVHTSNKSNTTIKGQDILIKAVGRLVKEGYDIRIKFIGDSEIKDYYYKIAKQWNIENRIVFTGLLSSKEEIREQLQTGDFFVLPTKMEGLPRSVIEAMAVGLPVISTNIAGIPELIDKKYLCDPMDVDAFVAEIKYFINNPFVAAEESKRNIEVAKDYTEDKLRVRRIRFYKDLRKCVSEGKQS